MSEANALPCMYCHVLPDGSHSYRECLKKQKTFQHTIHRIGSTKHAISTIEQTKTSLNPFDDKRYLLDDGITSYAYGHHRIPVAAEV